MTPQARAAWHDRHAWRGITATEDSPQRDTTHDQQDADMRLHFKETQNGPVEKGQRYKGTTGTVPKLEGEKEEGKGGGGTGGGETLMPSPLGLNSV